MRIVTGTGGFTVAWFVAIHACLRTRQRACRTWFALFGNSQGEVEEQHFYQATQNGTRTAMVFAHQSRMHIKEFWILILEYNNSMRAPWKRCAKIIETKANNRESN